MEDIFKSLAAIVALGCELASVTVLAIGAVEALTGLVFSIPRWTDLKVKKLVWVRFASCIALSLEFALAADIVRTAIAPSWNDVGQLAAIAAIRTFLNLFLERDLEAYARERDAAALPGRP